MPKHDLPTSAAPKPELVPLIDVEIERELAARLDAACCETLKLTRAALMGLVQPLQEALALDHSSACAVCSAIRPHIAAIADRLAIDPEK